MCFVMTLIYRTLNQLTKLSTKKLTKNTNINDQKRANALIVAAPLI